MTRWETYLALAGVILACLGAIPSLPGHVVCTAVAVVLLVIVAGTRLAAALQRKQKPVDDFDPAERARKIRESRDR
jgi:flagellar biosynthesis component FlhA